jgi:hypothetical protein
VTRFAPKIFGIGLQRTGTRSLAEALNILGYAAVHWRFSNMAALGFNTWFRGDFTVDEMLGIDGGTDNPFPIFFRELDAAYSGSWFVLTTREKSSWLRSCENLCAKYNFLCYGDYVQACHTRLYGRIDFDRRVFADVYDRHHAEVLQYFQNQPQKLLVIDWSAPSPWNKLCRFLQKNVPQQDFPWENRSDSYASYDGSSKLHEATAVASANTARKICPTLHRYYHPAKVVDLDRSATEWHGTLLEQGSSVTCAGHAMQESDSAAAGSNLHGKEFDLAISLDVRQGLPAAGAAALARRLASLSDVVLVARKDAAQRPVEPGDVSWQARLSTAFAAHNYSRIDFIPLEPWNDPRVISAYRENILLFAAASKRALFRAARETDWQVVDRLIWQRNRHAMVLARSGEMRI